MAAARPRLATAALCLSLCASGLAAEPALLREATIPLGKVEGRLDHLAVDLVGRRLFVAELGNDTVGVVAIGDLRLLQTVTGFNEPQGVGYCATSGELFVANGGDGSLSVLSGKALKPTGRIRLGGDADNVRVVANCSQVIVGYGGGALAVVSAYGKPGVNIQLQGHPEGFQILNGASRALVNVPERNEIAVIDLHAAKQIASWPLENERENFPMAVGENEQTVWVATRQPARLIAFDANSGARRAVLESCGDADDVMVDALRHRIYVICGSGHIDIWEARDGGYQKLARLETSPGARTALYVPGVDRLYLAVPANQGTAAAIWVYRPQAPTSARP